MLANLICLFVPGKENRRRIRAKFIEKKYGTRILFDEIQNLRNEVFRLKDEIFTNQKTNFEVMRLLLDSPSRNEFSLITEKFKSDKGRVLRTDYHTYSQIYEVILADYRMKAKNVFECGIGYSNSEQCLAGGSLRAWREYFPNAMVYGADINKEVLFEEERIKTYWIDQTSPKAIDDYFTNIGEKFDVMVEDGWHEFLAQNCMFENGIKFLKNDGVYIIEDVMPEDLLKHQLYFSKRVEFDVNYIQMGSPMSHRDNNLIVIKYQSSK
jgi:SAM-dependent methyltransferase